MDHTSTLPWWDDQNAVTASLTGLRSQVRKVRGWPAEAGPCPTSGERTVLHDRIARTPGVLADLEALGVEFPSSLRDEADQVDAAQPRKRCRQCEVRRPTKDFLPSPLTADGLTDRCKPCVFGNAARDRAQREARRAAKTSERIRTHV